ncbi:hypothetical protein Tco_1092117 [Tanacetum coccineum]|uniref:Uncharacterized protein n=1 Tax=Tanacetum coccineum TaxID=301880 RepID=A0ABQ5FGS0_9ASTR
MVVVVEGMNEVLSWFVVVGYRNVTTAVKNDIHVIIASKPDHPPSGKLETTKLEYDWENLTDMVKRAVEIETVGEGVDEIDKLAELTDEMQLKQEDQGCVHASTNFNCILLEWASAGLAYIFFSLVTPSSVIEGSKQWILFQRMQHGGWLSPPERSDLSDKRRHCDIK